MSATINQYTSVLIKKSGRLFVESANRYLKKIGITHTQSVFLTRLWEKDGQNQRELCESAGIKQPTVVRILDRMERDGLIKRVASVNDRRETLFYLTERAKKIGKKLAQIVDEIEIIATGKLTKKQTAIFNQLLLQVIANLEEYLQTKK